MASPPLGYQEKTKRSASEEPLTSRSPRQSHWEHEVQWFAAQGGHSRTGRAMLEHRRTEQNWRLKGKTELVRMQEKGGWNVAGVEREDQSLVSCLPRQHLHCSIQKFRVNTIFFFYVYEGTIKSSCWPRLDLFIQIYNKRAIFWNNITVLQNCFLF